MLEQILNKLFGIDNGKQTENETSTLRDDIGSGFYLTYNEAPNGYGGYCHVNICLHGDNVRRKFTDSKGNFINFPGYVGGWWEQELDIPFKPRISFPCHIGPFKDGKAKFMWQLQPDGRYFEDGDGFGAEKCQEIWLCSYIDEKGQFTGPFIYEKD